MKNTLIYKHKTTFGTVSLKARKNGLNPESLFLEVYLKSTQKRTLEFLNLRLTGDTLLDTKIKKEAIEKCISYEISEKKTCNLTFTDFFKEQIRKIDKPQSRNNPILILKKLHVYCRTEDIPFSKINESFLLDIRDWLLNRVLSERSGLTLEKNTSDLYFSTIMTFANRAQRKGYISASAYNRTDIPPIGKIVKVPVTLTEAEIIKLQKTPYKKQEICKALMFQFACGQRWGDVRDMNWEQIILEGGQYKIILQQEKTDKILPSFISENLMNWIGEGKERTGKIFTKLPSHAGSVIENMKKWCKLAGIKKKVGTHTMRRSCATILFKKEVPLLTISKILGHSTTVITMRYIGIDETDIKKGLDALKEVTNCFSYLKAS